MSYRPGERWDRERFERASGRAPVAERDYDEHDYYSRPGFREERDVQEEEVYRQRPQRDRVFFEEREEYGAPVPYRPRRESVRYYDDRETVVNRGGDMVPFREREDEREVDIKYTRESRPNRRPQFIRRQSSLDTFDRKPLPRYGDRLREEVVIPRPPRRRSPPRFVERDYEEIKVAEPEYYGDEEYRPYVEREVETFRRRYPEPPPVQEEIIEEKEEVVRDEFPKRGKTRMPRRLINIKAIIDLGYPYEEEGETIVIQQALGKEHIDEVIRVSREINEAPPPQETRLTYQIEAPLPPPPLQAPVVIPPPPLEEPVPPAPFEEEEIIKRETKIIRENPSLAETSTVSSRSTSPSASTVTAVTRKSHRSSHHSHKSHSRAHSRSTHRSKSTRRHRSLSSGSSSRELVIREREHDSHETALIFPQRERRSQRSLQAEIRALEAERKALKYEREAERVRHGNEVILEKEYRNGDIEIKKDRRGKLSLVRS